MLVVNNGPGFTGMHDQLPIDACQYNQRLKSIMIARDSYVEGDTYVKRS